MGIPHIPERFLRQVWQQQHFSVDALRTSDGRRVRILSPGLGNMDGGPDFLNARIKIGNVTLRGDVEIHQDAAEWSVHNHDADPHYNRVILHVVMTADLIAPPARTAAHRAIPLLALHPFLDATLRATWMQSILDERQERSRTIPCHAFNEKVPAQTIISWLEHLAHERVELKIRRFEERLIQLIDESKLVIREPYPRYYGNPDEIPLPQKQYTRKDFASKRFWEQLLYEGVMECMGYSKNRTPFLLLAQSMRLSNLRTHSLADARTMMALLFGAAGLLPSTRGITDRESKKYLLGLRRQWRERRPLYKGAMLHEGDWLFFRLRPANFPTARIAAVCHLLPRLFAEESFRKLIHIFKTDTISHAARMRMLQDLCRIQADAFWSTHYHFKGRTGKTGIAIGEARLHDIVVNAIVPIVLLYARVFKDTAVRNHALAFLKWLPPGQDHSIGRIIQGQLLREKGSLDSALRQQGAIQLFKFYCSQTRCSECEVGRLTPLRNAGS